MGQIRIALTVEEEELLKLDCVRNFPEVNPPSAQGWVEHVVFSKVNNLLMEGQLGRLNRLNHRQIKEALDEYDKKSG